MKLNNFATVCQVVYREWRSKVPQRQRRQSKVMNILHIFFVRHHYLLRHCYYPTWLPPLTMVIVLFRPYLNPNFPIPQSFSWP